MTFSIVVAELVDTIIYASLAGVGVAVIFSIAIYGATRFADFSHDDRPIAAAFAGIIAVVAFLACMVAAIGGLFVML